MILFSCHWRDFRNVSCLRYYKINFLSNIHQLPDLEKVLKVLDKNRKVEEVLQMNSNSSSMSVRYECNHSYAVFMFD